MDDKNPLKKLADMMVDANSLNTKVQAANMVSMAKRDMFFAACMTGAENRDALREEAIAAYSAELDIKATSIEWQMRANQGEA
jgi:hypothetical protein